jgi:membrane protease YdiL (CAAX protease family)
MDHDSEGTGAFTFKVKRIFLKTRGLILFVLLLAIPVLSTALINKFILSGFRLNGDILFLSIIQYSVFFILIFIIVLRNKKTIDFISKENWVTSLNKALIPAIMAFASGLLISYFFIILFDILPLPASLKHWMSTPNQGFIEIIDQIKKEDHLKVVLWFSVIVAVGPIMEEFLFRGFMQDSIGRIFKKYDIDVYLTSFIFSLFHLASLANIIYAFVVGYFLSRQRKKYSSINSTIFIHGLLNFTGLVTGIMYYYLQNSHLIK